MKLAQTIIKTLLEWSAIAMGLILISTYSVDPGQYINFIIFVLAFLLVVLSAVYMNDKHLILQHIVATTCVVEAFIGIHKPKINASQLILARRKQRLGSYRELYLDSIERYNR